MRTKTAFAFILSLLCAPALAQTGSVKAPTVLNAEVNSLWPDQNAGTITPFNARQTLLDIISSAANVATSGTPRTMLTQNTTFYATPGGVDSNNCTLAAPCHLIQRAIGNVCNLVDPAGFNFTIDATAYTTNSERLTFCDPIGRNTSGQAMGTINLTGVTMNSNNAAATISGVSIESTAWTIKGGTVNNPSGPAFQADLNTTIALDGISVVNNGSSSTFAASVGGKIEFLANGNTNTISGNSSCTISGVSGSQVLAQSGALINTSGVQSAGFICGDANSVFTFIGVTWGGVGATGQRYLLRNGAKLYIDSTGNSIDPNTVIPGNSNGTPTPWNATPINNGGTGATTLATAQAALGYPVILGGSAAAVNLNTTNTDTAITITSPTTNYKIDKVTVFNTGTTASLTTATAGLFSSTGGGGLALAAAQALSPITSNAINTDANSMDLAIAVGARTTINSATLQFRNAVAQGAAAAGNVYVWIRPQP